MESNPEPFKPHYCQLLQLLSAVLQDHNNPKTLYYCVLTLTAITAYIGTAEMVSSESDEYTFKDFISPSSLFLQQNLMRGLIPNLIVALKHLIKANEVSRRR